MRFYLSYDFNDNNLYCNVTYFYYLSKKNYCMCKCEVDGIIEYTKRISEKAFLSAYDEYKNY